MKDLKPLLYILLLPFGIISILFIITLFVSFTGDKESLKDLLSMTGTLGDTLGGITTCLVSGLTLYYIISTFRDQNAINQHTKSTNNFSIVYDLLKKIEQHIQLLKFTDGHNSQSGLDSIVLFENWILMERSGIYIPGAKRGNLSSFDFWNRFTEDEFEYFSKTIAIVKDLESWLESLDLFSLEREHKQVLLNEFNSIFNVFFQREERLLSKFYLLKGLLQGDENFNHNVNKWFHKIFEYQQILIKLNNKGVIKNDSEISVSEIKYNFDPNPFKIDKEIFDKI